MSGFWIWYSAWCERLVLLPGKRYFSRTKKRELSGPNCLFTWSQAYQSLFWLIGPFSPWHNYLFVVRWLSLLNVLVVLTGVFASTYLYPNLADKLPPALSQASISEVSSYKCKTMWSLLAGAAMRSIQKIFGFYHHQQKIYNFSRLNFTGQ